MKRVALVIAVVCLTGAAWWFFAGRSGSKPDETQKTSGRGKTDETTRTATTKKEPSPAGTKTKAGDAKQPASRTALTPEEKAARITKVAKDYEEIMAKAAADFSAAGASFPGGFPAYLRQLALLEREKWKDYADFLTPREVEDLQFREHRSGQLVSRLLGDTAATDEQRRAVLRLQREFDDKYALIFDMSPAALATREIERQAVQEQILGVLGPDLFSSWLNAEGDDYGNFVKYAQAQGLRPEAALEVWRIKNDFVRRRLEIAAESGTGPAATGAQTLLIIETRNKVATIVGPAAIQSMKTSGLSWLATK